MTPVSLRRLTAIYLRVANLTFGGGDPTMAALHTELVAARGWLSAGQYGLVYAIARVTPGTNMLAFCAGTAWQVLGWPGAILAVMAATLPAAAVVVLLTASYANSQLGPRATGAIAGMLAAAVGMMATGAWQLVIPHLKPGRRLRAAAVSGGALALTAGVGLSPIQVLALAAAAGYLWRAPESR